MRVDPWGRPSTERRTIRLSMECGLAWTSAAECAVEIRADETAPRAGLGRKNRAAGGAMVVR